MNSTPRFGAGLWHFASHVDRYATDVYREPTSTLEMIEQAGQVEDLSVVDLNYPFTEGVTLPDVKEALSSAGLSAKGITPEIYLRRFSRGAFTNPEPQVRKQAVHVAGAPGASALGAGLPAARSLECGDGGAWRVRREGVSAVPPRNSAAERADRGSEWRVAVARARGRAVTVPSHLAPNGE